jgi:hypothetical protein
MGGGGVLREESGRNVQCTVLENMNSYSFIATYAFVGFTGTNLNPLQKWK